MQNQRPTRSTNDQLSVICSLSALPFPDQEERQGEGERWSGPGYHLAVLRESQDFWEDRSTETVEAAEQALEADLAVLATILTDRWGEPETIDPGRISASTVPTPTSWHPSR
ncbi:hypothetical protein [Streptomyces sp. NPDC057557]|uniref:hypothetical protein n=1 Tax=Streptomyces sp. NPDC057557 TaxID=3346167 RepID=UPI00369FCD3E